MNKLACITNLLIALFIFGCSSINKTLNKTSEYLNKNLEGPVKKLRPFHAAWIKSLDPEYDTGNLPIGTGSPFIFEDHLYMGDLSGYMRSYDLETGVVVWEKFEAEAINSKASSYKDNVIYGTMSGRLFSRHYLTGELNYAIDLGAPIESEPVLSEGRLYIHLRNHKIVSLDAATGKIIWGYKRSVPFTTTLHRSSRVFPYKNNLIIGFADGNVISLTKQEGVLVWEQKISSGLKFVDVDATPIMFNDSIISGAANDKMRFVNPSNGLIQRTVDVVIGHTPIKNNGELIVGSIYGQVYSINKDGKITNKRKISEYGISSIVKWKNGYAVATMGKDILFLAKEDFEVLGTFSLGHDQSAIFGELQSTEDYLATYSSRNRLYVFKNVK